jgi:hypothetical protein
LSPLKNFYPPRRRAFYHGEKNVSRHFLKIFDCVTPKVSTLMIFKYAKGVREEIILLKSKGIREKERKI